MRHFLWISALLLSTTTATAAEPVTLDNIVRAESDTAIRGIVKMFGALGKFAHLREPTPLDNQTIIRMNRDTLYSVAIIDLSEPATVIMPETGGRYMSMHVVNQDHYMYAVAKPGRYALTKEDAGTRYVQVAIRTFVDANDPKDIKAANALQDQIKLTGGGEGPLEMTEWNQDQLNIARQSLNALATLGLDAGRAFGRKGEVDPIHYYVGGISGWGGLPKKNAIYLLDAVEKNDGSPYAVTAKDVPVNAFWSITVYNSDGFMEKNDRDVYSFNNVTATPNKDGAITIHFGNCEDGRVNCLPISQDWNYAVRLYEPGEEIINGTWKFPALKALN